jgi:hypothetical protein
MTDTNVITDMYNNNAVRIEELLRENEMLLNVMFETMFNNYYLMNTIENDDIYELISEYIRWI